MKQKRQLIDAALRLQLEAQERSEERRQQETAELYAREPALRRLEAQTQTRPNPWANAPDVFGQIADRHRLEGFVAGWLVGSGQFEEYAELFLVWLETVQHIQLDGKEPPSIAEVSATLRTIATQPRPVERQRKRPT